MWSLCRKGKERKRVITCDYVSWLTEEFLGGKITRGLSNILKYKYFPSVLNLYYSHIKVGFLKR